MALVFNEFLLEVAKGQVLGHKIVHVNGHQEAVSTGAYEDLWPYGGNYVDSSSAVIHYISSDNAADVGMLVKVWYLDANWVEQIITVTLNGQNKTQIGTGETMIRVLKAEGYDATPFAGTVYIYEDDTVAIVPGVPDTPSKVRGMLEAPYQSTMQSKWAIPASKSGILFSKEITSASTKEVEAMLKIRLFGKSYVARNHPHLYNSGSSILQVFPLLPEKTDIKFAGQAVSVSNASCSVGFGILLVDNDKIDFTVAAFAQGY